MSKKRSERLMTPMEMLADAFSSIRRGQSVHAYATIVEMHAVYSLRALGVGANQAEDALRLTEERRT